MAKMGKNGKFGRNREYGVVIDWSYSLSVDIIAIAPGDNILVNQRVGRVKGSHTHRHK